ncbi:MAG: NAD(P)/FAD-dependent oxidoreductase [Faecousia sp.]|nr:FAD-dependent oxidoreductase [Bacillota bacterium]
MWDVLILGGGPAGMAAALYCARAGLSVAVLEKAIVGGQMALAEKIENYPAARQDGIALSLAMQKQAEDFGASFLYTEIVSADLTAQPKVLRSAKECYEAPCVILATGAEPMRLGLPNEAQYVGHGLSYCATCDGRFFRGKRVAVVGGGNSAVSEALYLSGLGAQVHLLHRRSELRAEDTLQKRLFRSPVIFHPSCTVQALLGKEKLQSIITETDGQREELTVDGLFVAIGRKPESELFRESLCTDERGYLLVSEDTKTAIAGVFAAGDVRKKPLRQIVTAVSDGAVAAQQALEFLRHKA